MYGVVTVSYTHLRPQDMLLVYALMNILLCGAVMIWGGMIGLYAMLALSLIHIYDYGQMGVELKNNIKKYWWDSMVLLHENIVGIDSAIFMHPTIWKLSLIHI